MMAKLRSFLIENAVVILFVVLIAFAIPASGLPGSFLMQEILMRLGRNTFLVIALLLPIMAGMGLNFGMVLGAMAGQLGLIFITDWNIVGIPGLLLVLAFWLAVFWQGLQGLARGPVEHQRLRVVILTTLLAYLLSNVANGFWVGGLANMACALVGILVGLALNEQSAAVGEGK